MTPEEFNAYWTRTFPECPPVGFLLKHVYRERCARFRNFSNGRVHPASDDDYAEVCRRQNALLDHLFRSEPRVVWVTTIPSENEMPPEDGPSFVNVDPQGAFCQSLGMHEFELEFDTPSYWHIYMSAREFAPGRFDALLKTAAEDPAESGLVNVLFLGPSTRRLMHVYDGGADVVLESAQKRGQLCARYADWTADTPA